MRKIWILTASILLAATANATQYRKKGEIYLNDLTTTPGAAVSVSLGELCTPGYTKKVRNVSATTKAQACANYGVPADHCTGREVEIDHLISLELGGSNDIENLWPEPYQPRPGAREKDRLENWLHKQVCDGDMSLADAQQAIATDWYAAYQRMLQALAPSGTAISGAVAAASSPAGPVYESAMASGPEGAVYDFAVSQDFLAQLESGHTIQPTISVQLGQHSAVHPLNQDCELHVAGTPQNLAFGQPGQLIIEPPNVCKNDPSAAGANASDWPSIFDALVGTTCQVTGFPRIFTEHATSGGGASNPNHVFEIHPATAVNCGQQQLSFANLLRVYSGMRAISPSTATDCIANRQLDVRYDVDLQQYVFREHGGRCGNFAIVEVDTILNSTVRKIGGGHSAIARVSADGQSLETLKLYTLSPSAVDQWLDGAGSSNATSSHVFLHGLFTYDYFGIQKVVHPQGQDWQKPSDWTPIRFPLAFVVFGQTDAAPWEEP